MHRKPFEPRFWHAVSEVAKGSYLKLITDSEESLRSESVFMGKKSQAILVAHSVGRRKSAISAGLELGKLIHPLTDLRFTRLLFHKSKARSHWYVQASLMVFSADEA